MAAADRPEETDAQEPRSASDRGESPTVQNKYMAFAGMFESDPFIDDLDAYVEAERQRQRDEAARSADLEDVLAAAEEGFDMTTTDDLANILVVTATGTYGGSWATQDESDPEYNPYIALAGIFKDDPFAAEVEAHWRAARQRERDEAARLADIEDAAGVGTEEDRSDPTGAIADAS